jgi:toxin ParE1/3/4
MKLQFTSRARADIEDIYNYLIQRSPSGTRNVLGAIYDSLKFIAEHPYGSEQTDNPEVRATVVRRYRYKIFYSITGETIEVLHVRHTSRRPWGQAR